MERAVENTKQDSHKSASLSRASSAGASAQPLHPMLQLQQQAGNFAVQDLLRRRLIQPKLAVSSPDDPEEQEADQVAGAIMRKADGFPIGSACSCGDSDEPCESCSKAGAAIHRRADGQGSHAARPDSAVASKAISSVLRGSGRPLDASARAFFEPRFGRDFSHVRVHDGAAANASARSIQSHAYAAGSDIVFAAGQYSPETEQGRRLLAHELTHTIQSSGRADQAILQRDRDDSTSFNPNAAVADFDRPNPDVDTVTPAKKEPSDYISIPGEPPETIFSVYVFDYELTNSPKQLTQLVDDLTIQYGREACHRLRDTLATGARDPRVFALLQLFDKVIAASQARYESILNYFDRNAKDVMDDVLRRSSQKAAREGIRYGFFRSGDLDPISRAELDQLRIAATLLAKRRHIIDSEVDYDPDKGEDLFWLHIEQYRDLHKKLQSVFPILGRLGDYDEDPEPLFKLAEGKEVDQRSAISDEIEHRWNDIDKTREGLESGKHSVWNLPPIVDATLQKLNFAEGSLQEKLVRGEVKYLEDVDFWNHIALGVIQFVGVVLAPFTGGASLGLSLGIGLATTYEDYEKYKQEKAEAGTDFDRAQSIAAEDPGWLGLALDVVFVVFDAGSIGSELKAGIKLARAKEAFEELQPLVRDAAKPGGLTKEAEEAIRDAAKKIDQTNGLAEQLLEELRTGEFGSEALGKSLGVSAEEAKGLLDAESVLHPEVEAAEAAEGGAVSVGSAHVNPKGWIFICHSPCSVLRELYGELFAGDLSLLGRMENLEARAARAAEIKQELADTLHDAEAFDETAYQRAVKLNKKEFFEIARDADAFDAELRAFNTADRAEALIGINAARETAQALPKLSQYARNVLRDLDGASMERILKAAKGSKPAEIIARVKGQLFEEILNLRIAESGLNKGPLEFIPGWAIRGPRKELLTDGLLGYWKNDGTFKIVRVFEAKASEGAAAELIGRGSYIEPAKREALFEIAQRRGIEILFKKNTQYAEVVREACEKINSTLPRRIAFDDILKQYPDKVWELAEKTSGVEAGQLRSTAERLSETSEISAYGQKISIDFSPGSATLEGVVPGNLTAADIQSLSKGAGKIGLPTATFTQLGISADEVTDIAESIAASASPPAVLSLPVTPPAP
jgi:hypothetical protein